MSEFLKKPYEISIWKDKLVGEGASAYFDEEKIAIIGSDDMTSPNRAFSPKLTKNVNGEVTFTFSIAHRYFDNDRGEVVFNPFTVYLVNERKVKLYYDRQWYDFIIKNCEESSESDTFTYTCTDLWVNELGKTGYNVELAQELANNQGTVLELAKTVLESTDWELDEEASEPIRQWVQEPLYKAQLVQDIITDEMLEKREVTLAKGEIIYFFYSDIVQKRTENIQVLRDLDREEGKWIFDDNNVAKGSNYMLRNLLTYTNDKPDIVSDNIDIYFHTKDETINPNKTYYVRQESGEYVAVVNPESASLPIYFERDRQPGFVINVEFQGFRLNYASRSKYDPVTEKYVDLYKVQYGEGDDATYQDIYHYKESEYTTSDILFNGMTNGSNFDIFADEILGWSPYATTASTNTATDNDVALSSITKGVADQISTKQFPDTLAEVEDSDGCLKLFFGGAGLTHAIYNGGIQDNGSIIGGFSKGEEYAFRIKYNPIPNSEYTAEVTTPTIGMIVAPYTIEPKAGDTPGFYKINYDQRYFDFRVDEVEYEVVNNEITGGYFTENHETYQKEMSWGMDVIPPSRKYVYYGEGENTPYVWSSQAGKYVAKNSSEAPQKNGVNAWCAHAPCLRPLSAEDMMEKDIGIFLITNRVNSYWIREVEFFKYRTDADDKIMLLGSAPEAKSHEIDYFYIPDDSIKDGSKVETFKDIPTLAEYLGVNQSSITQVYNDTYEKIGSIEAQESNYFNIIQDLCEKFQCWAKFSVEHDENGRVTLDSSNNPIKKISFHEYAGKDNFAGFKYGINLSSIQRTLDSNEFVSKLIVAQPENEFVDGGTLTIRKAESNPTGESYILNFSYYLNHGLIDPKDFQENYTEYLNDLKEKNIKINELEQEYRDIHQAMTRIEGTLDVYDITLQEATLFSTKGEEDIKKVTGAASYEAYINSERTPEGDESVMEYLAKVLTGDNVESGFEGITKQLRDEYNKLQRKADGLPEYTITITNTVKSGDPSVVQTIASMSDFADGVSFTLSDGTNQKEGELTISNKIYIWNDFPNSSSNKIEATFTLTSQLEKEYDIYKANKTDKVSVEVDVPINSSVLFYLIPKASVQSETNLRKEIDELKKQKDEIEKNFFKKYGRYIQEGTWTSDDYVDHNLYYLDALQVSNTSAQPKVTYTINVVEVSEIEGLSNYLFNVGDKTYMEDTEFFGYTVQSGLKTPIKEEVIVAEVEWDLDNPEENSITIQNYKTQFEDLFQRIGAAVQSIEYKEGAYNRAASMLDSNGLINSGLLTASLNNISGSKFGISAIGATYVDRDGIVVTDILKTINQMKLSSKGLMVSNDAGVTWRTIVSPDGIDIGYIKAGIIDAGKINIMDGENTSFRWDKNGISAYQFSNEESNTYMITADNYINYNKTYYVLNGTTYEEANPHELHWFEKVNDEYVWTDDTAIGNKAYYIQSGE